MIVGGLDLALTKIGWARTRPQQSTWAGLIQPRGKGSPRLHDALGQVARAMRGCDLVVIEGPSYGSADHSQQHSQGKMAGVIELALYQMKPRPAIAIVAPSSLKKFATGKGFAKKEEMVMAARAWLDYGRYSDDEADAMWLVQMAVEEYALDRRIDIPEKQMEALESVEWPQHLYEQVVF